MKLLVLGASSQLGQALTALLRSRQIEHTALASEDIDLLREMDVVKAITALEPGQVINVGSYSNLEKAEFDEEEGRKCERINSQGVATLAEVCDHLRIPLIHHSTSYVFDGLKKAPYNEEDEVNPRCRYGLSKWRGEQAVREKLERHVILRTDWMFSIHRDRFFRRHIEACRSSGGKTQVMDHRFSPTPAEDVARVVLAIVCQVDCHAEVWGTYHYCALQPLSEAQFVDAILREAGKYDPELAPCVESPEITVTPPQAPYIPNSALNCQKIMETFGIKQRSRAGAVTRVLEEIYQIPQASPEPPPAPAEPAPPPKPATRRKRAGRKKASG